jgi:TonB family protein
MKCHSRFGIVVWLICGAFLLAQDNPSSEQKQKSPASSSNTEGQKPLDIAKPSEDCGLGRKPTSTMGPIEFLNDTMGVDFGPYLAVLLHKVKSNWYSVIPDPARHPSMESGRGKVTIEFAILKNGKISGMRFASASCDASLDRAAWTGITASSPFSPLPSEFAGQCLGLRFTFSYNPGQWDDQMPCVTTTIRVGGEIGVTVSPSSAQVVAGSKQQFLALVTGDTNSSVNWSVEGSGCAASACGVLSGDGLYTAPIGIPNPATVTVNATLATTPSQTSSSVVTIVQSSPSH